MQVYYGGTLVLSGELSSGALTSFLLYALTIGAALGGLAGTYVGTRGRPQVCVRWACAAHEHCAVC